MSSADFPRPTSPAPVRGYRDLLVWQRSMQLAVESYRLAVLLLPRDRGLADQLRRASASIAMNIAEGHGRLGRREFAHALSNARGSFVEVETILHICEGVGLLTPNALSKGRSLADEISRMLAVLIRRIAERGSRRGKPAEDRQ